MNAAMLWCNAIANNNINPSSTQGSWVDPVVCFVSYFSEVNITHVYLITTIRFVGWTHYFLSKYVPAQALWCQCLTHKETFYHLQYNYSDSQSISNWHKHELNVEFTNNRIPRTLHMFPDLWKVEVS